MTTLALMNDDTYKELKNKFTVEYLLDTQALKLSLHVRQA